MSGGSIQGTYPTFCLHRDVFRIAIANLKLMTTFNQFDTERHLTAVT